MKSLLKKISVFVMSKCQFYLLSILNYIIPKSENKVFIFDKRFRKDNVWAISEYLSRDVKYSKYKIFYYTKADIPSKKNITYISNGIYALWNQLRSKYIFYSYSDIKKFKPSRNQIVVDTMHGSPLKNIGYLVGNSRFKKLWRFEESFTYILCVSDFFKDVVKKALGQAKNNV